MPYKDYTSPRALASRQRAYAKRKENRKLYKLQNPVVHIPKQFCLRGHDKIQVGTVKGKSCRECMRLRSTRWNTENPDRKRDLIYRKNYGISLEQYNNLLANQKSSCAICGIHQSCLQKRLNVDHDHMTGKVRGLLCWECNKRLGWLENKDFCAKATIYLQGVSSCL